ncbi:MAG: alpha/beta hydrolase [Proteobacteria bacterium]|nr:alpha/beta hydrolase [Pseudomonadota bacterium]
MRTIATLIAAAVGLYVLLGVLLFFMQERMLFLARMPGRQLETSPRDAGFDYVDVNFETADGVSLHGWYVYADNPRGTVLFLHGNAGNISHRLDSIAIFHELGLDTFIIDYRGYGQSEGKTSEEGTYRDADAAWEYLVSERGLDPARIVVFGRSLGGAVASWLATQYKPAALIVESSFTSVPEMAAHLYPFIPVRHMLRLRYPVIEYVTRITSPVLIVHSRDDDIIPFSMGQALYEAAPAPKAFLELSGDHNNGFLLSRERYRREVGEFIQGHLENGTEQN